MTDSLGDQVVAWLRRGGYPLEYETARAFRGVGFPTEQGRVYKDPIEEATHREADVVATLAVTAQPGFDTLVVAECKSLNSNPWVILTVVARVEPWEPVAEPPQFRELLRATPEVYMSALVLPDRYAFSVVEAELGDKEPGKGTRKDRARDAMQQVVSAAVGIARQGNERGRRTFVLPVVVTSAPMFILTSDTLNHEQVERAAWARVYWRGAEAHPQATIVDVVSQSAFETYATDLRFQLGHFAESAASLREN